MNIKKRYTDDINDVIIVGCSIEGLYAGIKLLERRSKVYILEKKRLNNIFNDIFAISSNQFIINKLVSKYNVPKIVFTIPDNVLTEINMIIEKTDIMPPILLINIKFGELCEKLIKKYNFENFKTNFIFYNNLKNMTAISGIMSIKKNIIGKELYYIELNKLLVPMIKEFFNKGGIVKFKTTVCDIQNSSGVSLKELKEQVKLLQTSSSLTSYNTSIKPYYKNTSYQQQEHEQQQKQYQIYTISGIIYNAKKIILTINKKNLLNIPIWNETNISYLNSINIVSQNNLSEQIEPKGITLEEQKRENDINSKMEKIREYILDNYNIAFPLNFENNFFIKTKQYHYWKDGNNSSFLHNKIKTIFGNTEQIFIGNEGYSKNQGWINGGLDMINDILKSLL